ncbi:hypothetical protein [Moritella sp.]|uniref:hypothetical protein n=1 Tax=Moritella sp. TaxID=78556 RepID=UPI0025E87B13|nr:hypothetical protein [Moritella sp.]MCJ8349099.1 hypothetical protein [Moritella sp.]
MDVFQFIKITFSNQSAGLGLKIMAIAGCAFYMHEIGASKSLVRVLTRPLMHIKHMPYLFMAICFLVGEFLSIFITSASGLGVLLMVTLYPLMRSVGLSPIMMTIVMVLIIMVSAILMGSGNAAFLSFANLVPDIAGKMGIAPVMMLLPMQFVAGMSRNISPITPNMVAIAGVADVSPFDLAKRTAVPMMGGIIISIFVSILQF